MWFSATSESTGYDCHVEPAFSLCFTKAITKHRAIFKLKVQALYTD